MRFLLGGFRSSGSLVGFAWLSVFLRVCISHLTNTLVDCKYIDYLKLESRPRWKTEQLKQSGLNEDSNQYCSVNRKLLVEAARERGDANHIKNRITAINSNPLNIRMTGNRERCPIALAIILVGPMLPALR